MQGKSKTHGQNNCLIDSILMALQEQHVIRKLDVDARAAVCSSVRRGLIEQHGVEPEDAEYGHAYLSHEESFHHICERLRLDHPDIWSEDINQYALHITAIVSDRTQRRQLYDSNNELDGEVPDDRPVESKPVIELDASEIPPDPCMLRLYCNTHNDIHCTPYHYEWISCRDEGHSEDEESNVDDDNIDRNSDHLPLDSSDENGDEDDENEDDHEHNPAPPSQRTPMSDMDDSDGDEIDFAIRLPIAHACAL